MIQVKKLNLVQKIEESLTKNKNFSLFKIGKTSHQALESLRKELKKSNSSLKVVKNTLFEKAVAKLQKKNKTFGKAMKAYFPLKENSGLLILDNDWTKGLSSFFQFSKKETALKFKFGLLDGKTYNSEELSHIAQLPGKDQLISNILGSFNAPVSRTIFALKFNLMKLTNILKEKSKKAS